MHKKCKEILEHLEKDKKIKISSYKFPEKEELKLRLKDLLEEKVDEKYYLSDEKIKRISNWESHQKPFEKVQGRNSIVPTLTARGAGEEHSGMIIYSDKLEKTTNLQNKLLSRDYKEPKCIQVGSLTRYSSDQPKIQESFVSKHYNNFIKENGYLPKFFNPYHETEIKDIAPTQTTNCGSYGSSASVCIGENECKINEFPSIIQKQGDRGTDKYSTNLENSYTISANPMSDRNQLLVEKPKATESDSNFILGPMQNHASINRDGITPTLTSAMGESGGHVPMHNYDFRIRKLTPKECWRLMDFDDEDFEKASKINSNTQLYKQAGNSIVVNVLAKIIGNLGI